MTRIDFYLNAASKLQVACQIAAKAIRQQAKVLIMAPDEGVARSIDQLMWTMPATGFLPHCMSSDRLAPETPVLIARSTERLALDDVLLNLGTEPPPGFTRFRRLIEIVSREDEADRQAARERFRFYRDRGYELHHHDLAQSSDGKRNDRG